MLSGLLFISIVVAAISWTAAVIIASSNPQRDKVEAEKKLLEEKCAKLADHVLYLTGDTSLGGEQQTELLPAHLPATQNVLSEYTYNKLVNYIEKPEINEVDLLIDSLRTAPITGITSEKHSNDEVNKICYGYNPLVILSFGDISIRDSVWRDDRYPWFPDVIWKGYLLPSLTTEQYDKVHKIFSDRMAGEARKSLERSVLNSPSF